MRHSSASFRLFYSLAGWRRLAWMALFGGALLAGALLLPGRARATPTAPVLVVNHVERQCAQVIQGDECSWCDPPAWWEIAGPAAALACPDGYTWLERLEMQCRRYEIPFCCYGGSQRGDCRDMLVNPELKQCAFVDSLAACAISPGWQAMPEGMEASNWACPSDYQFAADLVCTSPQQATADAAATLQAASQAALGATQTALQASAAAEQLESTRLAATQLAFQATQTAVARPGAPGSAAPAPLAGLLVCIGGAVLLGAVLLGAAILALALRRR
jgi:hypothetical protein